MQKKQKPVTLESKPDVHIDFSSGVTHNNHVTLSLTIPRRTRLGELVNALRAIGEVSVRLYPALPNASLPKSCKVSAATAGLLDAAQQSEQNRRRHSKKIPKKNDNV